VKKVICHIGQELCRHRQSVWVHEFFNCCERNL